MHRWTVLMAVLLLPFTTCGDLERSSDTTPEPVNPGTPQEFIDRIDTAMVRDQQVLQMTVEASGHEGDEAPEGLWRNEIWIYAAEEQARHLFHLGPHGTDDIPAQTIFVIDGNRTYSHSQNGTTDVTEGLPARTCPQVETPLLIHHAFGAFCSRFVPQDGEANELTARLDEDAEFDGTPAVALVYEARNELESGATPEPERLPDLTLASFYLDPESWLPLGWTVEMQDESTDLQLEIMAAYSSQFIPREQLPDDFFDPPTIDQSTETAP